GDDPIAARLIPPELIMSHQSELSLDDKQRGAILKEIERAQSQVLQIQWQMQSAAEQLAKLLDESHVDETKTLAQADKVMELERQIKRNHLGMLVRIRNLLTDVQRSKLQQIRAQSP
ncbi:MAG: Heavy-metal resistance protein, partial [bacterium]|nr:Heavy-metal resistance protein [bacterium]